MCKHPLNRVTFHPNSMRSEAPQIGGGDRHSKGPNHLSHEHFSNQQRRGSVPNRKSHHLNQRLIRQDQQNNNAAGTQVPKSSRQTNKNEGSARFQASSTLKQMGVYNPKASGVDQSKGTVFASPSKTPTATPITPSKSPVSPGAYAGAKFSDPPSPKVLPKPPMHWFNKENKQPESTCSQMTNVLKNMLKVQA